MGIRGLTAGFIAAVRRALRLNPDPDSFPRIDYLARYEAKVVLCASDGSTVDVEPLDPRIKPQQRVLLRVSIPGLQNIIKPDSIVTVYWERGDPARMRAEPSYAAAAAAKVVIVADLVVAGAEGASQFVALENLVGDQLGALKTAIRGWTPVPNDGGAALKVALTTLFLTWPGSVAATQFKAK